MEHKGHDLIFENNCEFEDFLEYEEIELKINYLLLKIIYIREKIKMERNEIIELSKKINCEDLNKLQNDLNKEYNISYGKYDEQELKKALEEKKPIIIKNHFLIGYENKKFIDIDENKIPIERMIKAVIIEDRKEQTVEDNRDIFAIVGKNKWDKDISQFNSTIGKLRVGEIFLPPHSAVFNFLEPTEEMKKEKIVSTLEGININLYSVENYVDNSIHEVGHLFWRDCLILEEKKAFKELFQLLKPSAIYEYEWEREDEEEVFCTIYKWYVKSLLLNNAFYNILAYEEPRGLELFQKILNRIARDRQIIDIWNMNKQEVIDYLNPRYDISTGKRMRKAGDFEKVKDVEIPVEVLNNIDRYEDGIEYIKLNKAITVPVIGNRIDWDILEEDIRNAVEN
jgi:hypothetical protein